MRPCVIFNPTARGEKAVHFREQLVALGDRVNLKPTRCAGDGRTLAADATRQGFTTIVAAGGDGTVNEVINGIHDAGGFPGVRLGLLPLGTINVFAREFGIPSRFEIAWRVIEAGHEIAIDLPSALFPVAPNSAPGSRVFAQLAGAGLDSRAIALVNWELKKKIGPLAYVHAGFKALAEAKPMLQVIAGHRTTEGELVLIGNGRYYGGHFELFPQADPADGLLDVTVFPKADWPTLARAGWGWLTDQIHTGAGCVTLQANRIEVSCPSTEPVALELDGDNVGLLPAVFHAQPRALRVLVPPSPTPFSQEGVR